MEEDFSESGFRFEIVAPWELIPLEELTMLERSKEYDPSHASLLTISKLVASSDAQLWRMTTEQGSHAVYVTQILVDDAKQDYMVIWRLGGKGAVKHAEKCMDKLTAYAKSRKANRIECVTRDFLAGNIIDRCGFKHAGICVVKEL